MPRKTRKVNPGIRRYGVKSNYTHETLEEALNKIRSGAMSRLAASKFYKIPAVTLFYKLNGKHNKSVGKPVTFSKNEETSFVAHLLLLSDLGIPLSMMDFRYVVKNYLDSNNITKPQFKNNLPGYEWGVLFLERNPDLKAKIGHNISRKRAQVTREMVENFFENIKTELEGVPPENVYNMDESGFHDDPGKKKLLFRRDSRHPEVIKNTSKSCYTVVFCANAGGEVLPPFFIFKGKKLWSDWLFQAPAGSRMAVSESGWIDSSIFEEWLERHFIPYVDKQDGKKVLLCDNLSAHISPKALLLCNEHNITFVCLIPNSTHLLQPLDVGYFSGLKTAWRSVLNDYRQTSKGKKVQALPKPLFAQLLKKSLDKIEGTSSDNVKAGFKSCGLQPISPSTVLNKLPTYTSQAEICDSVGTSFIHYIEEIRQGDLNVKKGTKFQLPVTAGKSVSAEEVVKYYEERDKTNKNKEQAREKNNAQAKRRGRPMGSKNKKKKKVTNEEEQEKNEDFQSDQVKNGEVEDTSIIEKKKDNESQEIEREIIVVEALSHPPFPYHAMTSAEEVINTQVVTEDLSQGIEMVNDESTDNESQGIERKVIVVEALVHSPPPYQTMTSAGEVSNTHVVAKDLSQGIEIVNNESTNLDLGSEVILMEEEIIEEYTVEEASGELQVLATEKCVGKKDIEVKEGTYCIFKEEGTLFPGRIHKVDPLQVCVLQKNFLGGWSWPSKIEICRINEANLISILKDKQISRKGGLTYIDDDILFMEWGE